MQTKASRQEKLLAQLRERLEKEQRAFTVAGLPEYGNRLCRTRLNSSLRKECTIARRIAAIRLAIDVVEKPFREVDVREAVILSIPDRDWELKAELLNKAESVFPNEQKEACRKVFEQNRIIALKQLSEYLD